MGKVIDCFAGGGGASTGIEAALGRPCDIAVNHDPKAIAMHRANHPRMHHVTAGHIRPTSSPSWATSRWT